VVDIDEGGSPVNDLDAAEQWLDSWVSQVDVQAERSVELSRRVAALTGSADGRSGAIRVAVGSSGQVTSLELDDRVHGLSGSELARDIMTVMRRAQAALSAEVTEQVQATVGADSETGRAVIGSFGTRFPVPDEQEGR
jgi:hypothetical protein